MYWLLFYAAIVQTCKAASQPSKEYVETCGWHWQERYIKLHNEIVFGATSPLSYAPRLVIAIPVKAGLADMVLGYVSAFLWALLTDRAFLIARLDHLDDSTQRTIEFGYHSPFINWTAPCVDRSTFACLLPPYGEQWEKCRDTIDILGHSNLSVYHNYGVNGGFTNDMLSRNISLLHSEKDVLTTASNRGVTVNIFKNEFLRQQLLSLGLTNTTAFPCLFNFLFRLNHDVCDLGCKKTAHQLQHAKHNVNVVTIALHVRNPGASAPEHYYCADSLIDMYKKQGKEVLIVLVTTSAALQTNAMLRYKEKLLLPSGVPEEAEVVHDRSGKLTSDEVAARDRKGIMDSARDYYIMSLADVHILSPRSGFGVVGSMLRLTDKHIMFRLELEGITRNCSLTPEGDPISVFADDWSSL